MKTLFIARHAKSSWEDTNLDDFDRPLNNRGKKNAPEMGKRLKKKNIRPDLIISSTAKRAFTTAKKIAEEIGYPLEEIEKTGDLYLASIGTTLSIIHQVNDKHQSLMIFGHNPGWTELSNYLSDTYIDNVPTSGVVAIEFKVDSWKEVNKNKGKVLFFDYPKKM